jgi:hypothetical protein
MVEKLSSPTMFTTEFRSSGLEPKGGEFVGSMLVGSYSCRKRHALISSSAQLYTDLRQNLYGGVCGNVPELIK